MSDEMQKQTEETSLPDSHKILLEKFNNIVQDLNSKIQKLESRQDDITSFVRANSMVTSKPSTQDKSREQELEKLLKESLR